MMFSAHVFFELWLLPMFMRSVSYNNAMFWNNKLALGFYSCLQNPTNASSIVHEAKSEILAKDWNCTFQDSKSHHLLAIVSATDVIASSWNRIWDEALEFGVRGTTLTYTGSLWSSSQTNIWRQSLSSLQ